MSFPARLVFDALPGAWTLTRDIEDARAGAGGFAGAAHFTAQADGALLYEEHGELTLGAWRGPAWRRWRYSLEGDALVIRYPDTNAELHSFRFAEDQNGDLSSKHAHHCREDRYDAVFRRLPNGAIMLTYAVTGPAKDYRLSSALD